MIKKMADKVLDNFNKKSTTEEVAGLELHEVNKKNIKDIPVDKLQDMITDIKTMVNEDNSPVWKNRFIEQAKIDAKLENNGKELSQKQIEDAVKLGEGNFKEFQTKIKALTVKDIQKQTLKDEFGEIGKSLSHLNSGGNLISGLMWGIIKGTMEDVFKKGAKMIENAGKTKENLNAIQKANNIKMQSMSLSGYADITNSMVDHIEKANKVLDGVGQHNTVVTKDVADLNDTIEPMNEKNKESIPTAKRTLELEKVEKMEKTLETEMNLTKEDLKELLIDNQIDLKEMIVAVEKSMDINSENPKKSENKNITQEQNIQTGELEKKGKEEGKKVGEKLGEVAGESAGKAVGTAVGGPAGGEIGGKIGKIIGKEVGGKIGENVGGKVGKTLDGATDSMKKTLSGDKIKEILSETPGGKGLNNIGGKSNEIIGKISNEIKKSTEELVDKTIKKSQNVSTGGMSLNQGN